MIAFEVRIGIRIPTFEDKCWSAAQHPDRDVQHMSRGISESIRQHRALSDERSSDRAFEFDGQRHAQHKWG
jgi:hypothetical protein